MLVRLSRLFLYAALVTPLVFANDLIFPFITGKVILFQTFVICSLVIALFAKKAPFQGFSVVSSILSLFGASLVISSILGVSVRYSFLGNYERGMGVFNLACFYLFYFLVVRLFDKTSLKPFICVGLGVSCIVSILGIFQYVGWPYGSSFLLTAAYGRVWSTLGNYLYLSSYALFGIFFALKYLFEDKRLYWRLFYAVVMALNIISLVLGGSRGSMLGAISGVFFLILVYFVIGSRRVKINMITLFVIAILAISLLALFNGKNDNKNNLDRFIPNLSHFFELGVKGTGEQRLIAWISGWQAFKERPIFGWGNENITTAFNKYYNPRTFELGGAYESNKDRYHNFYLDVLVQQGIVGFLLFLALITVVIHSLWKKKELILLALWISVLVGLIFIFPSQSEYLWLFILFAYASIP